MFNIAFRVTLILTLVLYSYSSWGAEIKVFVAPFVVTGAQNRDELKGTLQTLLSSRMSGKGLLAVESPVGADFTVSGSYSAFGKVFSIDAVAKTSDGAVISRTFSQGSNPDDLIPAIGKLAKMLVDDLSKAPTSPTAVSPQQVTKVAAEGAKTGSTQIAADIIRPEAVEKRGSSGWISQRLPGALIGIAQGRTLGGERELFVAGSRSLRYYLQGKDLKLVAEISFDGDVKVLSVDAADLDGDGIPEIYLTMMKGGDLSSQVWQPGKDSLIKVADNLQYFFRGIALRGKEQRIYAQERGLGADYYGDVNEVVKSGNSFSLKNPIKLPRFGNIFNFNIFTDSQGKSYFVEFSPDGHLLVYSLDGELFWESSDKFGGSETYFPRQAASVQSPLSRYCFLDQRIVATPGGEIIVPQNSGFFVIGDSRSYSKSELVAFSWNGSSLEEKWRTRQSQNYLADYAYDEAAKDLLLLEVVQKEGLVAKGASAVAIKKVE